MRTDCCATGRICGVLPARLHYSHAGLTMTWDMGHRLQCGVFDDFGDWVPIADAHADDYAQTVYTVGRAMREGLWSCAYGDYL